jgi:OmpA-OmpF porin, OOP family
MENRHSVRITLAVISLSLVLMIGMLLPSSGYGQFREGQKRTLAAGEEVTTKGVILNRSGETFVLRDMTRTDTVVVLTDLTKIRTERKGLLRGHKPFDVTMLVPGLILTVQGKGDGEGRLMAEDITASETDISAAVAAYVQSAPVAKQAAENKGQIAETKTQLSETDKKLAETSQEVKDTNKRISELDQFDVLGTVTVLFDLGSYTLKDEAKKQLDELAAKAPGAKNYTVEVKGYADKTGDFNKNLELSQNRAEAVTKYLTVKHNIPLRRITMPMGYGETKAVSEGETKADLAKDRRVEVTVLVNKGLGPVK